MHVEDPPHEFIPAGLSKNRIEALTDGIFVIAMRLGEHLLKYFPAWPDYLWG
jgi:hypothetical protein